MLLSYLYHAGTTTTFPKYVYVYAGIMVTQRLNMNASKVFLSCFELDSLESNFNFLVFISLRTFALL